MDARPTPAAPAPPPLQASITWANPSPSLYQFPSYTARLNENPNPNPNPNPEPFFIPSDGYYYPLDYGSFKRAPSPKKGISSEGFAVHENITNYWPRNNDTSLPGISGYGYGCSGQLQEYPPYYLENPYKISESSAGPVKCTTPYSVSGHITNISTSSKILKASHHVENGTKPSIQVPWALPNPTPSFQQSDTVLVKDSGFQFSSKPIENAKIGKFQKIPIRIGRVRPHPHKSTHSDIHNEEKVEARNAGKEMMEAKDNQRTTQLEQVESVKQSMSLDENAVQHSSSCRPHATSATFPGDTVGTIDSSVLMAEDAPLDVILEAFRYLSGILSSTDFDVSELEDHDRELLQFVMDNRRVFTVKNKKDVTNNNFQDSRTKDAQLSIVRLKTDATKLNKGSHDVEEKLLFVASNMNNDELESVDHLSSSDLSIHENVAQTIEKTFQSNFSNNEESLHAQVYKKLWIDAEAALCSLKYELQLVKMKIEAENCNHQTEKLQQSPKVSSLNTMHEHAEQEVPIMAKEVNPAAALPTDKDTQVLPIIARFSSKDREDTPNSTCKEHQQKSANFFDLDADGKLQQLLLDEANKMRAVQIDVETLRMEVADVMARLKVLKDRDDRPNSTNTIEQPNSDVLSDLEVRDATFWSNGSEIDTSTRKSDGKISQGLNPSVCSTNTEASSRDTQPDAGGEASIFSSEWEFELL